jgi:hypothetical protein
MYCTRISSYKLLKVKLFITVFYKPLTNEAFHSSVAQSFHTYVCQSNSYCAFARKNLRECCGVRSRHGFPRASFVKNWITC